MRRAMITVLVLAGTAAGASAQDAPASMPAARAALAECLRYAEGDSVLRSQKEASKAAAERAERAFRAVVAAQPQSADAHAGLGEAIARCAVPHAGMSSIMNVIENATQSLQAALKLDEKHWQARFMLAMMYHNMPAFFNKGPDAIREFETLRAQQGARADAPHFAMTWLRLGDAYRRAGRSGDAQAAYAGGAKLFPTHEELQRKAAESGGSPPPPDDVITAGSSASPTVYALAPLRIEAAQHQLEEARSTASLKRLDVLMMPGGTAEMLQTLQALPGTTRAGDGADLYVRGGDPEETPIFVNGGRLAFPGRWESLSGTTMGVLDANVLSRAYFSAGGFSAKYGNALSGVVDVETHGRPAVSRWRAGINLVSAGASAFRPLGDKSGFWSTAMLTDVSLLARLSGQTEQYPDMPRSYQAVAGGSYAPVSSVELKAVGLASGDEAGRMIHAGGYRGAFRSTGQTQHGALSARWLRSDGRAGINASLTASRRAAGYDFGVLQRERTDRALGGRVDGDLVSGSGGRVRAGLELTRFDALTDGRVPATPSVSPGSPSLAIDEVGEHATHAGAYIEGEQQLGSSVMAVVGLRADRLPGLDGVALDPRAAIAYSSGTWTLRAGAGTFHQGNWRRRYYLPDAGTPSGVPTRARHVVLGAERAGEPSLRLEAFAKRYDEFAQGGGEGPAAVAGTSTGIDAMLRWQRQAKLNGWLTYSLLDAELELENGSQTSAKYDVTHSVTAVARYALSDAWEIGTTARYATGKPFTPVLGAEPPALEGWPLQPVHGTIHSERLPYYGRIDARITRYEQIGGHMGVFYLEMLDLNGRRNVMGYQYDASYTERRPVESFFARRTFVLGAEVQF